MTYEDFFDAEDVAVYRRVKRGSMKLARVAREVAADMVDGEILITGKEFVHTPHGMFRLAMAYNSDNSTERIAHIEMGAITVIMGDSAQMREFFRLHGYMYPGRAMRQFRESIQRMLIYEGR
jgi:hypothetical protein